jgi:hypothetical protein
MKLTAKHLGLITALLFGVTHAEAPEADSVLSSTRSTASGEAITLLPVAVEADKPLSSSEALNASLTEVSKALKEGIQTTAEVAKTIVDVIGSGLFIGKKVVILAMYIGMVGWFTAKALYIIGSITAEFYQTTFASQ